MSLLSDMRTISRLMRASYKLYSQGQSTSFEMPLQ